MKRHYALDSIVVRGRRVFGWGFCLGEDAPLAVRSLRVPLDGGGVHDLEALPGGHRADLVAAFPQSPHAGASGFMMYGRLPAAAARGAASLVLEPTGDLLPLPDFPDAYVPATDVPVHRGWSRLRSIARQRGWGEALLAAIRGLRRRVRLAVQPEFATAVAASKGAVVVLDHGMGGGASRYRQGRIAALRERGLTVVQVHSELSSLSYRLQILSGPAHAPVEQRLESQEALVRFIEAIEPRCIEVNNLVGFEDVPSILERVLAMKRRDPALRLRFNLHDFHALCPSFTLIDASGRHCGVPSLDACRACLPANGRFTLGMNAGIDVEDWRKSWAGLLAAADERVAFSRSALLLLDKGLPGQRAEDWRIEPHAIDAGDFRKVSVCLEEPLNIVAVGHLNHAKGATLVGDLARRAGERGLPLRFTVIGTLEGGAVSPAVRVTGAFERRQLCDLLEAERVGIALLPSICPETYSYVTDEIMATGLPLAVLDLGAPAERVGSYHAGLLLPLDDLDAQLDVLVEFGRTLRTAG